MSNKKDDEQVDIESLLGQMSLARPSKALDESVEVQLQRAVVPPVHVDSGFRWRSMVVVSLAASLIGVIVGRFTLPLTTSPEPTVILSKKLKRLPSQIVDQGFELLDGETPVRVFQVRRRGDRSDLSLPVLKKVIVRSPEI